MGGRKKRDIFNIVLKQTETLESFRNATKNKKDAKTLHHHLTSYPKDSQEQQKFFTITFQAVQRTAKSSGYTWLEMLLPILCYSSFFLPGLKSNTTRNTRVDSCCPSQLNTFCSHQWPDKATKTCCGFHERRAVFVPSPWPLCVTEAHEQARGDGAATLRAFRLHQWTQQCFLSGCTRQLHPRYIKGYVGTQQPPLFPKP